MTPDKVEAALGVLRGLRDEMKGLPHSLGYEYTHMAKVDEALSVLTEALADSRRDAARYRFIASGKSRGKVDYFVGRVDWGDPKEYAILTELHADTAIDAAMKETP